MVNDRLTSIGKHPTRQQHTAVTAKRDTSLGQFAKRQTRHQALGKAFDESRVAFTRQDRGNHTHILGSTGTGKSKFLEHLLRQDVLDRHSGLCLIDPHGSLYDELVLFLSHRHPRLAERVVLFHPAGGHDQVLGFNPIPDNPAFIDYTLDMLISACLKAWGQDKSDRTPRITKWLENIFYPLIINRLTLVESVPLINIHNNDGRRVLLRRVSSDVVLDDWMMFESSTQTQKQNLIEGAANRLRKFLRNDIIRQVIGQQEHVLQFDQAMDEGKIVLVNLAGGNKISHENTQLLGILLVNEIFRVAKLRNPRDSSLKPFYLYIDEFAQFVTRDIARALEEARKFKLFLTLAHQHLAQLREEDEYLYASVLTNCKNKVVFGGLSKEDAEIMNDEINTGFLNLQAVKYDLHTTKVRHVEETRTVTSRQQSQSQGTSSTQTQGKSESQSKSDGVSRSTGATKTQTTGESETTGSADTSSTSNTSGSTQGTSNTRGSSNTTTTRSSDGQTQGMSQGASNTHTTGASESHTSGTSSTQNWSHTSGRSDSQSRGQNRGHSDGATKGQSFNTQSIHHYNQARSQQNTRGNSQSSTSSNSRSDSEGGSNTKNQSDTKGTSHSDAQGQFQSSSQGSSHTTSQSQAVGEHQSQSSTHSTSQSYTEGSAHTESQSTTRSHGHTTGTSHSEAKTQGTSQTQGTSHSTSHGTMQSQSTGEGESTVPFLRPEEYTELTSRTFWSKEELSYMAMAAIKNQGVAEAYIKIGNAAPKRTRIETVRSIAYSPRFSPQRIARFEEQVFLQHASAYISAEQAQQLSQARQVAWFGEPLRFDESSLAPKPPLLDAPSGGDALFT